MYREGQNSQLTVGLVNSDVVQPGGQSMKLHQTGGQAKKKADKEKMKDIETDTLIIYRIAKKMKQENKDMYSG